MESLNIYKLSSTSVVAMPFFQFMFYRYGFTFMGTENEFMKVMNKNNEMEL